MAGARKIISELDPHGGVVGGILIEGLKAGNSVQMSLEDIRAWLATILDTRFTTVVSNPQTGDYTLVLTDPGKSIDITSATAVALTIPPNSVVPLALGAVTEFAQMDVGQITVTAGAGVNLVSAGGKVATRLRYSAGAVRQVALNTWLITGDLA